LPHFAAQRTAAWRAAGAPEASSARLAPLPPVSSRIASTGSVVLLSIAWGRPELGRARHARVLDVNGDDPRPDRGGERTADWPTGPWPKTTTVSRPVTPSRMSAPYAVPVPHEMAAPVEKISSSGRGMSVPAGAFM
jgi:hypothetical protein